MPPHPNRRRLTSQQYLPAITFAIASVTLLQDGAKGYDIIDFCFLRPEFHEVSAAMSQPPCRAVSYLSRRLF